MLLDRPAAVTATGTRPRRNPRRSKAKIVYTAEREDEPEELSEEVEYDNARAQPSTEMDIHDEDIEVGPPSDDAIPLDPSPPKHLSARRRGYDGTFQHFCLSCVCSLQFILFS